MSSGMPKCEVCGREGVRVVTDMRRDPRLPERPGQPWAQFRIDSRHVFCERHKRPPRVIE